MLTKYPLGVKKVLPFTLHSAGDYAAAALLLIAPMALGFRDTDGGLSALYAVLGIAVVGVSLITDYQYSDEVQAVPARAKRPLVADRSAR